MWKKPKIWILPVMGIHGFCMVFHEKIHVYKICVFYEKTHVYKMSVLLYRCARDPLMRQVCREPENRTFTRQTKNRETVNNYSNFFHQVITKSSFRSKLRRYDYIRDHRLASVFNSEIYNNAKTIDLLWTPKNCDNRFYRFKNLPGCFFFDYIPVRWRYLFAI